VNTRMVPVSKTESTPKLADMVRAQATVPWAGVHSHKCLEMDPAKNN
jgi:hypothetical protein